MIEFTAEQGVENRRDLIQFIRALSEDFQHRPEVWENCTLDSFLEAMSAWLEDADGLYKNLNRPFPEKHPTWGFFAEMLLGARVYE